MKRFINKPSNAQAKFAKKAFNIHPMNFKGVLMRGGIRLS